MQFTLLCLDRVIPYLCGTSIEAIENKFLDDTREVEEENARTQ